MKNLDQTLNKYYKSLLIFIFIIAVLLRWVYLPQKSISFAFDQARDAFLVQEIINGHLKILGPSVSGVPGLYHGVLYYYVIAPLYFLGHGDPVFVAFCLSFISSLGVFIVYFLTKVVVKSRIPALIAALIFAFSFEATQYANLLTNASMGVWFVPIIYLGLYLWINKGSKFGPAITGLALGLSVQSEIALMYHLPVIVLWLFSFRKNVNLRQIFIFISLFILAVLTMIISEFKFGFTGVSGIFYLLSGRDGIVQTKNLSDYFLTLLNQSGKTFAYTIFPINIVFGGLLGFAVIIYSLFKKDFWAKFLSTYIFAYSLALPFGGWNMRHILVGVAPAISIFVGIFIWRYLGKYKVVSVILVLIILLSNLITILKENKSGQTIFPLQVDLTLKNELNIVDYSYQKANGKDFSISTLTSPLYVNTLWSYLYNWHGKGVYGYLPSWIGHDQIGQLGNNLKFASSNISQHFFIIEPTYGIPDIWVNYAKGDQNSISDVVGQKSFGEIIIEERNIKPR